MKSEIRKSGSSSSSTGTKDRAQTWIKTKSLELPFFAFILSFLISIMSHCAANIMMLCLIRFPIFLLLFSHSVFIRFHHLFVLFSFSDSWMTEATREYFSQRYRQEKKDLVVADDNCVKMIIRLIPLAAQSVVRWSEKGHRRSFVHWNVNELRVI